MTDGPCFVPYMIITQAGEAVRTGLDELRALAMITINARQDYRRDDLGSARWKRAKTATLLIFDGMPAVDTRCAQPLHDHRRQDRLPGVTNKQTRLARCGKPLLAFMMQLKRRRGRPEKAAKKHAGKACFNE